MLTTRIPDITSEYFLHYIWRTKQFERLQLKLSDCRRLEIIDFGRYNTNSGPDFLHGKIRLEGTVFAGHIEMHLKSSDWVLHQHQCDPAYNSVVLHVVGKHDREVFNQQGHQLITLEIGDLIDPSIAFRFNLLQQPGWIPCENLGPSKVASPIWTIWKERLNIERLQSKVDWVNDNITATTANWEEIMYRQLFKAMGTNVNKDAFITLAERIDHKIFQKNKHDEIVSNALVFGMAGLLDKEFEEAYPTELRNAFHFLKRKYDLTPLNPVIWRYSKMHPHNFPDIRLAQIVSLLRQKDHFFATILENISYGSVQKLLDIESLHPYWNDHFILGVPSVPRSKNLGKGTKDLIIINAIVPVLFMYGHAQHLMDLQEKALDLLTSIPAEQNGIIKNWQELNISCENAQDSQALLELKNNYCDHQRCLQCSIGHNLLK